MRRVYEILHLKINAKNWTLSILCSTIFEMKKAIVIGASSGIGEALAKLLAQEGYEVGLAARRLELLQDLQKEIKTKTFIKRIDVANTSEAKASLDSLLQEMGQVDLIILNAGIIFNNHEFDWEKEESTIVINALGFAAMAHTAMQYFLERGKGHLVGISSISAIRGESDSPSYSASKAFVSNFLEGLRIKAFKEKKEITVTDIQPGWVDTVMAKGEETFWMASPEKAAEQIYSAIKHKRSHAYITRRWRLYAWLLKLTPRWAYARFFLFLFSMTTLSADFHEDLVFAYQTLKANHPGPYNALDPNFSQKLEENFHIAEQKLKVEEDKQKVLKEFGRSFQDSHLRIWYESAASPQVEAVFDIQKLNGCYWISIPTFYPSEEQKKALYKIIQLLPELREQTVIFDLRGNRGGSFFWGRELIKALFGKEYTQQRLSKLYHQTFNHWRLSPGNLEHVKVMISALKSQHGETHSSIQWSENLYQELEKALNHGDAFYVEAFNKKTFSSIATNPVKGKIIAIIDRNCYSATLMFIDELKAMQDIILLGETTGADSMYMELRDISLPSGNGKLGFPIRVYQSPSRGHNVPYHPDIHYPGNLQETANLQSFVLKLNPTESHANH